MSKLETDPYTAAAYDLLIHPRYGLRIDPARFRAQGQDSIDTSLDTLDAEDLACSPVLLSSVSARQTLSDMAGYVDCYPVIGADGLLNIKLIRQNDPPLSAAIDESMVMEDPQVNVTDTDRTLLLTLRGSTHFPHAGQLSAKAATTSGISLNSALPGGASDFASPLNFRF